jgi:alkylation response protein AidB-like acyl-CoA dehydrogenase
MSGDGHLSASGHGSGIGRSGLAEAQAAFRPVFDEIAAGAVQRELDRELPFEPIARLRAARFGGLRVPLEHGGRGLTLRETASLLIELATADSNVAQALRGHFAFVEDQLSFPPSPERDGWLRRLAAGELVGNAWSEIGTAAVGVTQTTLTRRGDELVVNGTKYYSTGTIFADWTDVVVRREDGTDTAVVVRVDQPGVVATDDWSGFGQRLSGSGTTVFTDALVEPEHVFASVLRAPHQTPFFQLELLAVLAGIAAAVERDAVAAVRTRSRVYSHGLADHGRDDAQIQEVVGAISAIAFGARAAVLVAAEAVGEAAVDPSLVPAAGAEVYRAQVLLTESVPRAATLLFDALGSSGVATTAALDRHWRNARTVGAHNPVIYKQRIVGEWALNGMPPPLAWSIGVGRPQG